MEKRKISVSHQRRVSAYVPPKIFAQIEAYRIQNSMTRSEATTHILREHFDHIQKNQAGKNHY